MSVKSNSLKSKSHNFIKQTWNPSATNSRTAMPITPMKSMIYALSSKKLGKNWLMRCSSDWICGRTTNCGWQNSQCLMTASRRNWRQLSHNGRRRSKDTPPKPPSHISPTISCFRPAIWIWSRSWLRNALLRGTLPRKTRKSKPLTWKSSRC